MVAVHYILCIDKMAENDGGLSSCIALGIANDFDRLHPALRSYCQESLCQVFGHELRGNIAKPHLKAMLLPRLRACRRWC